MLAFIDEFSLIHIILMMQKTYLFYDIETTGLNKCFDQVIQFAAIRTDLQLKELERYEWYVNLNEDSIPSPKAFITHQIPLSFLAKNGINELQAATQIHQLFNEPGTITLGYNTLRFDDELLRFTFYRNLLPPYTHQFANDCGRMDLYPMCILYYLYHNELLTWPKNNLKLENISQLNNFSSGHAHNAMTDVIATLNLARRLYQHEKMWDYACGYFNKQTDTARCQQASTDKQFGFPLAIMIDGKFGYTQNYQSAVTFLGNHKYYKNQSCWLRLDLKELTQATSDHFKEHTFVIHKKLGETGFILPLKDRFLQPYLLEQQPQIQSALSWLEQNEALYDTISTYYRQYTHPKIENLDASAALYDKGFISSHDEKTCKHMHKAPDKQKLSFIKNLSEKHLQELGLRILGRHFRHLLQSQENQYYSDYLLTLNSENGALGHTGLPRLTRTKAIQELAELQSTALSDQQKKILGELFDYFSCVMKN